jgi:uncharacterized protein YjdB
MNLKAGGATGTITATVEPANATNKNVTWTSSDISIATVENGVVTPKAEGTATITAKTNDGGKTAECTVMVGPAATIGQQFPDMKLARAIATWLSMDVDDVITKDVIAENIPETNDELYLYGISDMTGILPQTPWKLKMTAPNNSDRIRLLHNIQSE